MVEPGHPLGQRCRVGELGEDLAQRGHVLVRHEQHPLRPGGLQDPGGDRVPLGVVAVQQLVAGLAADHLGELPAQVEGVLQTQVEALTTGRRVDVRGVAGQQHPAGAVPRGLPGGVGEPAGPAHLVQHQRLGRQGRGDLGVRDRIVAPGRRLHRTGRQHAEDPVAQRQHGQHPVTLRRRQLPPLRATPGQRDVRDQGTDPAVPAFKINTRPLSYDTPRAVAAHQIPGPLAVHRHPGLVLTERVQRRAVADLGAERQRPVGQPRLDPGLRDADLVRVRRVQHRVVERDPGEVPARQQHRRLGQDLVEQSPGGEHLGRARLQVERLGLPGALGQPLQHQDPRPAERQLPGQHQPGRPGPRHDHVVVHARRSRFFV
ncbi:hypothetical protein Apa02nite_003500 [Actinoplanes palleronii]|uniref:Uncharacterized protein n=1 Tax=Actinoplanes palleronii TaxID=113570 RepID=A0ABQ4B0Z7_9ACTN|nr:hypothetical protein [Actinoplanes palleronii]GIE64242.1 hypothetical protein Apa02nite_003500 [Actinoplanes palleronii]